jgi:hypothetical protein
MAFTLGGLASALFAAQAAVITHHVSTFAHRIHTSSDMSCLLCLSNVPLQHGYDYGQPDYIPFLPGFCSGICLGSIICFAHTVMTFLQPRAPSQPIVQQKKGQQPRQTLNNARGYVFGQYGELKHLPAQDDPTAADISASDFAEKVNAAIASAGALKQNWIQTQCAGGGQLLDSLISYSAVCPCVWLRDVCRSALAAGRHQVQIKMGMAGALHDMLFSCEVVMICSTSLCD